MSYPDMYSGLMPGEWDALQEAMRRTGSPFGRPSANPAAAMRGGILGTLDERLKPFGGLLGVGANLLSQSGQTGSFGGALGNALLQGQQRVSESEQDKLRSEFMQAQIERMRTPDRGRLLPVLRDGKIVYEYEDKAAGAEVPQPTGGSESAGPASLQEWAAYQKMSPEQRQEYLNLKRQPSQPQIINVGGVPSIVDKRTGDIRPLSSQDVENAAAAARKQAEAQGTMTGDIAGQAQKRAVAAGRTLSTIEQAKTLIEQATGSMAGAGVDAVAGAFGGAPRGAQAIAGLKVLQANLMTEMPRMEGPQSDRDVQLYREAAGQIGDPTVPRKLKLAALATIEDLQKRYQAGGVSSGAIQPGQTTTINGAKVKRTK